jgi:hypothetical protein
MTIGHAIDRKYYNNIDRKWTSDSIIEQDHCQTDISRPTECLSHFGTTQ